MLAYPCERGMVTARGIASKWSFSQRHWGQRDYLLDVTPDELFLVIPCVFVYVREVLGELVLNYLAQFSLPKLFAN